MLGWSISGKRVDWYLVFVLVPFDVGVVYIGEEIVSKKSLCFSPLRCWGGLYQKPRMARKEG